MLEGWQGRGSWTALIPGLQGQESKPVRHRDELCRQLLPPSVSALSWELREAVRSLAGKAQMSAGHSPQLLNQLCCGWGAPERGLLQGSCLNYADSNAAISLFWLGIATATKALKLPWQSKAGSPQGIIAERSSPSTIHYQKWTGTAKKNHLVNVKTFH